MKTAGNISQMEQDMASLPNKQYLTSNHMGNLPLKTHDVDISMYLSDINISGAKHVFDKHNFIRR